MKLIVMLCLCLVFIGCGPHFNTHAQPDLEKPAATPPTTLTLTIPNWPVYGYLIDDAIIILVVKDATVFPIPKEFAFTRKDGSTLIIPMIQPAESEKK
jgi:hypothetical protein